MRKQVFIRKNIGAILLLLVLIALLLASTPWPRIVSRTEGCLMSASCDVNGGLKTTLDVFKADCGRYPTQAEGLKVLIAPPTDGSLTNWRGPYFDSADVLKDPWGHEYIYRIPSTHGTNDYDLFSMGPDGRSDTGDDIGNWM